MTRISEPTSRGAEKPVAKVETVADKQSPDVNFFGRLFSRLQKIGYRKFPYVIPDPERDEFLKRRRDSDADANARSEPSSEEVINLRCIWAVEFYTPSQISNLLNSFDKLGWNTDDILGAASNPGLWIRRNRESSNGGGWLNLGAISQVNDAQPSPDARHAPLPHGIEYAIGAMYSLTSSITCIVIGFVLDGNQNRRYEQALRRKRQTYLKPLKGRGFAIVSPDSQKATDINAIRAEIRNVASNWFCSHLPGLFASGNAMGNHPTCEFMTLSNAIPFSSYTRLDPANSIWLNILNIGSDHYVWQADRLSGLKFVWPFIHEDDSQFHAAILAQDKVFSDDVMKLEGGTDRNSIIYYVDKFANTLLSRWAILGMLSSYERYLNNLRDGTAFDPKLNEKPFQLFEDLCNHLSRNVDILALSVELQEFAGDDGIFRHDFNDFHICTSQHHQGQDIALSKVLKQKILECADWIRNFDRSISEILIQYGNALGARENIKLQGQIATLTKVIVGLTFVILLFTAVTTLGAIKAGNLSWLL